MHLPGLISDLALILCSAAIISLLFKRLKQPVVLGYILAGTMVGPNFHLFPTIVEIEGIQIWADIGVIFLLFALGLEFSFKKLIKVGGVAVTTALIGVGTTMFFGYWLGRILGWSNIDCLFLGGILAIASTTIIFKAFDELGVKSQKFAGIVMGVLIVEDLVAVVLMVILSTVAIGREFEGMEMIGSVVKLVFFLILWFVSGIFFIPTFLKRIRKLLNEESLLIVSLALCFLMVVVATKAGFSSALGAFIMGSILAETTTAEQIEKIVYSLKSLFGAIFFVSVGMLLDIQMILNHALPIIAAIIVLLIVKPFFVSTGAIITGQSLKVAVQSGMSLSQIGEFSFIIASLGLSLHVTSDFLYPIAVAVSVTTTFTTPFMIRFSGSMSKRLETWIPQRWNSALKTYSIGAQNITEESSWRKLLRSYFINISVFSVVIITIIILSMQYLNPLIDHDPWTRIIAISAILAVLSPFLWALSFHRTHPEIYAELWKKPAERGPLLGLMALRIALAIFYIGFTFQTLYSSTASLIGVIITCLMLFLSRKKVKSFYGKIELRFFSNLNDREKITEPAAKVLTPWDSHLSSFIIGTHSPFIGKTLLESKIRENFGVNIAAIKRGDFKINVPTRMEIIYPNDVLSVIGTDDQLKNFKTFIESTIHESQLPDIKQEVSLQHFTISNTSSLVGKNIRDSGIRELSKGLVVGIERNGQRILNPESNLVFEINDKVWIVGNEKRIQVLAKG